MIRTDSDDIQYLVMLYLVTKLNLVTTHVLTKHMLSHYSLMQHTNTNKVFNITTISSYNHNASLCG